MESALQSALYAYNAENYVPFDDSFQFNESKNPEKLLIQKDLFEKLLSEKTKQTVYLILSEPDEMSSDIRDRGISWSRVKKYLHNYYGMTGKDFKKIQKEMKRWLKS